MMTSTHTRPRQRVRIVRHRGGFNDLQFIDPCVYCGLKHWHGAGDPKLFEGTPLDGTYGTRAPHCAEHTHDLTKTGKRKAVTATTRCNEMHDDYVLVTEDDPQKGTTR